MYWLLTLSRSDRRPLVQHDVDHVAFLERFLSLGQRWGVSLKAFLLAHDTARLVVAGGDDAVGQVGRLQQSGWGVWRHYRGETVSWEPSRRVPVAGPREAVALADALHGEFGLPWPWSSLREALGLRVSGWVEPTWLRAGRAPLAVLRAAAPRADLPVAVPATWRARAPVPWPVISGVSCHASGREPEGRSLRRLRIRLAWSGGWAPSEIARQLEVQPKAIARNLRGRPEDAGAAGRVLLADEGLRPDWLLDRWRRATAAPAEAPCRTTLRSWTALVG